MTLTAYITGLALVDSLNPIILGLCVALLLQSSSVRTAAGFTFGVFLLSLVSSLVIVFGLGSLISLFIDRHETAIASITVLMGIACMTFGVFAPRLLKRNTSIANSKDTVIAGFLLGLFTIQTDLITLTPFLTAMQLIMAKHLELARTLFLLLWYNTMIVLPMLLLIAVSRRGSFKSRGLVQKIARRIENHAANAVRIVSILLGIAIAASGATMLFEAS